MNLASFKYVDSNEYALPEYGFKIHISGTLQNYKEIFDFVLPFLDKNNLSYKYLKDEENVFENLSDMEIPSESGKLITIYPKDREHCKILLKELYNLIPIEFEGVYILSDRNYKDSNIIFYRYGLIQPKENTFKTIIPTLIGPNGEQWKDFQKCYFDLPKWIEDLQEKQIFKSSYLTENYKIEGLLKQSNGGNIYKATNITSKKEVVIKESRSHVLCTSQVSKIKMRDNEWNISKMVTDNLKRIEKVDEWVNKYYIYEYIDSQNVLDYCNELNLFSYSTDNADELETNLLKFYKLLTFFNNILETVRSFHSRNIILNDIHNSNFIINNKNKAIFIDLENSYLYGSSPLVGVYSEIGLKEWITKDGKISDCNKVGNLLLFLIGKLHIKNNNILTNELKKLLLQKGIHSNIDNLITYLLSDDATIEQAIYIARNNIYAYRSDNNYYFNDYVITCNDWNEELTKIISLQEMLINQYSGILGQPTEVFNKLKSEPNLGLDGTAGVLLYLHSISYDNVLIEYGIEFILKKLVKDFNGNKGIKISDNSVSPYLSSGTAGIIQLLINVDPIKYISSIKKLSEALMFEFAQFCGIWDGMLGIGITLLQVYEITMDQKYLNKANNLLISSKIMSEHDVKLKYELMYVIQIFYRKELG
ncbi:class III lanthionine synthetase LanKC N-terminal domain-containing protein [Streptococcus porcinus]|uniref:Kinase n=1 Tax=Streptococcus porcinus TaxID=1340 RepID=A0A7W0ARP2_STRPO|nr:kinase [Streptococcus porcinus]MBA2796471.1 kinase [Streptococcus porcinus]